MALPLKLQAAVRGQSSERKAGQSLPGIGPE